MWDWLIKPRTPYTWGFIIRVLLKASVLFVLINLLYAVLMPTDAIVRLSLYNLIFNGRERLPYGENPAESYNITMDNIPAMFATHAINRPKTDDEFRVVFIGDSATWGFLLHPYQTLTAQLTQAGYLLADGRRIIAYNIAHPVMSLTKDLMLLDEAMGYDPDMVVWLVTLQSFSQERQLGAPITQNNPARVQHLIAEYGLSIHPQDPRFVTSDFFNHTIIGQRRMLADWLRIQFYGATWHATSVDHVWGAYALRRSDFDDDHLSWENFDQPQAFIESDLAFDMIYAGHERVGDVPLIIINEPMFISTGHNSDLRYNSFYPRWAYDGYRVLFTILASDNAWRYCDLWDSIPAEAFTDSPVHMTAEATSQLSRIIGEMLTDYLEFGYLGRECD